MHHITPATAKSTGTLTVAMVAGMPYPMAKASCIRVGHLVDNLAGQFDDVRVKVFAYEGTGNPASHPHVEYHLVGGFDSQKAKYYTWSNKLRADARLIRAMIRQRKAIDLIHCHTIEGLGIALAFKALTLSRAGALSADSVLASHRRCRERARIGHAVVRRTRVCLE
jgi:hypothetical protein